LQNEAARVEKLLEQKEMPQLTPEHTPNTSGVPMATVTGKVQKERDGLERWSVVFPSTTTAVLEGIGEKVGVHYPVNAPWRQGDFLYLPATVKRTGRFVVLQVPQEVGSGTDVYKACPLYTPHLASVPQNQIVEQTQNDVDCPFKTLYRGPAYYNQPTYNTSLDTSGP